MSSNDPFKTMAGDNSSKVLDIFYDGKKYRELFDNYRSRGGLKLRIGKTDDNDIALRSLVVEDYHATITLEDSDYYLYDGQDRSNKGQYKPSEKGVFINDQRIKQKEKLKNGDVIKIRRGLYNVTLRYYDPNASNKIVPTVELDREITIGRNSKADLTLNYIDISNYHARIIPKGKGHVLEDLGSTNGTFVDEIQILPEKKYVLQQGQKIKFSSLEFQYDGQFLKPVGEIEDPEKIKGHRLDAIGLCKRVKAAKDTDPKIIEDGKITLLSDISLVINAGEFVALVGGSGAGKSTLLDALNASRPVGPEQGKVLVDGEDLYQNFDKYREKIGYVPQRDILHEDLSVKQVLQYAAKLRRVPSKEIEKSIDYVLSKVNLGDRKDTLVRNLSGGQKKRVSIAVELISDPVILFLDEPTSGLDPGLDKSIMELLRGIVYNEGKTVVLVTHATENIEQCDMVAFLAYGGRLVYYGPPKYAYQYFDKNEKNIRIKKFSVIYQLFNHEDGDYEKFSRWEQKFKDSRYYSEYVKKRLEYKEEPKRKSGGCGCNPVVALWETTWPTRQMAILFSRYWATIRADKLRFLGLIFLAPILAVLVLSFPVEQGIFSSEVIQQNQNPQTVWSAMIQMQQAIFIMACIATFFGLFGAIQEISKERHIYDREKLINLKIRPYVFSKQLLLSFVSLIQAVVLVYIFGVWAEFPEEGVTFLSSARLEMVITIFLTLVAANNLGLMVSALVKQVQDRTLPILAILVIIQIVFGGVMFKLEGQLQYLSYFGLTRWSTEALGISIKLGNLITSEQLHLVYGDNASDLYWKWLVLLGYGILFSIGTIRVLKKQDITRKLQRR